MKCPHPMQQKVKKCVGEISGVPSSDVLLAVDGCNLPALSLSLRNMALICAWLAGARDDDSDISNERKKHLARIHRSVSTYPELVGREGRSCTDLMRAYKWLLVGKVGATLAMGFPSRSEEDGSEHGAIGVALKVENGNLDVLYAAVTKILAQLGIGTDVMREKMEGWRFLNIYNTAGVVTDRYTHNFKVERVKEKR
jgi:L-asparaginase II